MSRAVLMVPAFVALWVGGAAADAASGGMIGHSGKDPRYDCSDCHHGSAGEPQITVAGPVSVDIDSAVTYTIRMYGEPGSFGGINIAASAGTLGIADDDTRVINGELTQRASRVADDTGTVRFGFRWRAPPQPGPQTLYIAAVLGNADSSPAGDNVVQTSTQVNVIDRSASTNDPPRAQLQLPAAVTIGEKVMFSAVQSNDEDGKIVSYAWDFGDGESKTGASPVAHHEYKTPGLYTPQVTVTDDDGATGSALAQIEITALASGNQEKSPAAVAGGPYEVAFGDPVQFDAGDSRPGMEKGRIVAYEWDFGDGYAGSGVAPRHYYAQPGAYITTLTVWDDRGLPGSARAMARVRKGEWPRIGKLRVPAKVSLTDGLPARRTFNVVVNIAGLGAGITRCGVVHLERNNQPYQNNMICFVGSRRQRIIFEHDFTEADAPSVSWTTYVVLDPDIESRRETKTTGVQVASSGQSDTATR